jgi:nucleotide-binding universal stress UspA family protein
VLVARSTGEDVPRRVVCGIDGSEGSAELATFALSLAVPAGAELKLVHVAPIVRRRSETRTVRRRLAAPEFERLRRGAEAAGVSMATKIVRGHPGRRLIKLTKRLRNDLLIVGHRGVHGVRRAVLGSVSELRARRPMLGARFAPRRS